jgi:general stress protein 26
MAVAADTGRVWDIVGKVGVCMMTTRFDGGMRARPLEARPDRDAGLIWFLTDRRGAKDDEIDAMPEVGLVFIDHAAKAYLSITASATVVRDRTRAADIWRKTDAVWWSGPEDSNLRVLRVAPQFAELWDGPASDADATFEFVKARMTGDKPDIGENRKVTVPMQ